MHFAAADSLSSIYVLRDLEIILLVMLFAGLLFHGVKRLCFPKPSPVYVEKNIPLPPPLPPLETDFAIPLPPPPPLPGNNTQSARKFGIDVSHFTPWDFLVCFIVLAMFLASPFVAATSAGIEAASEATKSPPLSGLIQAVAVYGLLTALILAMLQWVGGRSPVEVFGLNRVSQPATFAFILIGASIAIFCILLISSSSIDFLERLFGEIETQAPVKSLQEEESMLNKLYLIAGAIILAPLFEELVFRGYFYGILKKYTDPMFSAFITGGIFAVIHVNIPSILPLWFLGIFLALAYEASRSLWVPIGIHALFNATTIAMIFLSKGEDAERAVEIAPAWLTLFFQ